MRRVLAAVSLFTGAALLAGCSDGTGPTSSVAIRFGAKAPAGSAAAPASAGMYGSASAAQQELVISGTNGTLRITDIRVIVDEFELERVGTPDCDVEPKPAGCADFEIGPFFVDVPLTGAPVTVTSQAIPAGSYKELEFEVDDTEVDSDEDSQAVQALLNTVRQAFPDWPLKASMVVVGTFTPTGGTAQPFRVYFDAEIKVELELVPPLVVGDAGSTLDIQLNPERWFKHANGTVRDLSLDDFATTEQIVEFRLEIEQGFELEIRR